MHYHLFPPFCFTLSTGCAIGLFELVKTKSVFNQVSIAGGWGMILLRPLAPIPRTPSPCPDPGTPLTAIPITMMDSTPPHRHRCQPALPFHSPMRYTRSVSTPFNTRIKLISPTLSHFSVVSLPVIQLREMIAFAAIPF